MPVYDYECDLCHHVFERKQRFDEEPVAACPECEGKARRVINSVPIIFKGSGFYITDNRKGSGVEKAEGTKPDKSKQKGHIKSESTAAESH